MSFNVVDDHPSRARGNRTALNEHASTTGEIVGPAHREARRDNLADERRIEAGLGQQVLDRLTDEQVALVTDQLAGGAISPENDALRGEQDQALRRNFDHSFEHLDAVERS